MIDDLKFIHERDSQDALGVVEKEYQQLKHDFKVQWQPKTDITSVAVAGMGGSALSASLIVSWPQTTVPFSVIRDYELPLNINSKTLFIASSYSGNTEETLSALKAAEELNCQIVVLASGGSLAAQALEKHYPLYQLPGNLQPRMSVFFGLAAMTQILVMAGLVDAKKIIDLQKAADWLGQKNNSWRPDSATKQNQAKQIALELIGKSVVIYSGPKLFPAAYKWKINFNENAKQIAWVNQLPEFNHNEMLGWTKQPVDKPYSVIDIRSNLEHPKVQKRFVVSERLLSGLRPAPIVVVPEGETILKQLLWTINLGDFVSLYLALLNNLDPSPVDLITKFKKTMDE